MSHPQKAKKPKSPPSSFSSLHNDVAWQILARVPKRMYPILASFSKNLRSLVRSPEIHKIRSLLRKDSLYICFMYYYKTNIFQTPHWFTLRRTESENHDELVSVDDLAFPDHETRPSIVSYGPEIFFISGSLVPSSTFWILDTRTNEFRQGPNMSVERSFKSVGLVGSKIYVVGGYTRDEIHRAESFDVKTQTWEPAPRPDQEWWSLTTATVSLDKKVCALMSMGHITVCYDPKDGSCEVFELPKDVWWSTAVCVMDNVVYVCYARFGLMWYDTELKLWRVVNGLDGLKKVRDVAMGEYYGKLAFLWSEYGVVGGVMKEIWCRMIALERSEGGINGVAEPGQLMGSVPCDYRLQHCVSVSE